MKKFLVLFALMLGFTTWAQNLNQYDQQGQRHGKWQGVYEESKRKRYEGTFEHGKEVGTFTYFDDTQKGDVIATREFKSDGTVYAIFYNQHKQKVSEGKLVNKVKDGEWLYYHFNSKNIMMRELYQNGQLEGEKKVFYSQGQLAESTWYKNGKKDGLSKRIAENGVVLEEVPYVNGLEHGEAIYRDAMNNVVYKGQYVNGAKKGTWEVFEDGKRVKTEKHPMRVNFEKRKDTPKNP